MVAYGGGFYYMPFNLFAITATAGFSDGEKMLNFSLGDPDQPYLLNGMVIAYNQLPGGKISRFKAL